MEMKASKTNVKKYVMEARELNDQVVQGGERFMVYRERRLNISIDLNQYDKT